MLITKNFPDYEIKCPCCGGLEYDPYFFELLQIVRTIANIPFHVTSGYRCRLHNDSISGVSDSRHLVGSAVDVDISAWSGEVKWLVMSWCFKLGLSVGFYPNRGYLHIDKREGKPVLFP